MSLEPGKRLGPYEILSPIGAGGMGEVYKARDARLERTVAVKVLPPHMSASPEVRQRFEREAKTISQLSHPYLGDKDQIFDWWEKACEDRSFDVIFLKVDPLNDDLRDDPRFAELLRKAGLSP